MKYALITLSTIAFAATPALAGGKSIGGVVGNVVAPVTAVVSGLNVTALNNVSVLSGNKVNAPVNAPVTLGKTNILSGILSGNSHGCGCN